MCDQFGTMKPTVCLFVVPVILTGPPLTVWWLMGVGRGLSDGVCPWVDGTSEQVGHAG